MVTQKTLFGQRNKNSKQIVHPGYTTSDLIHAVDILVIIDDPATHPTERAAAHKWFARVFLKLPIELRRRAIRSAKAIRAQKGA